MEGVWRVCVEGVCGGCVEVVWRVRRVWWVWEVVCGWAYWRIEVVGCDAVETI